MFSTAFNVLSAPEDKKNEFIAAFGTQITENDKRIANVIAQDNNRFGSALVSCIRLALCHVHDNSTTIHQQMDLFFSNTNQQNNSNLSLPPEPFLPPSPHFSTRNKQTKTGHPGTKTTERR